MVFFNTFLKTIGILLGFTVFILFLSIFFSFLPDNQDDFNFKIGDRQSKNTIAVMDLNGPIVNNLKENLIGNLMEYIDPNDVKIKLNKLEKYNPNILIIKINSPGGTVSATSSLEKIINDFKKKINAEIYFYSDEILASGGYWISTTGNKIYANYGAIIGSIGVSGPTWYYYNKPKAISNNLFGQTIETIKGIEIFNQNIGNSKDLYNPYRKPTDQELYHLQSMLKEIYENFILKVSKSRKIEKNILINDIGALIFTSNQAKNNFLIDDVINFEDLINQIVKNKNFVDYKIIENNLRKNLIKDYFSAFLYDKKNIICNKLNTNFSSVFPIFLNTC